MNRRTVTRLMRTVTAAHVALYRMTRGRLGSTVVGMPVLLLTTKGRKTGRLRTTPLTYIPEGQKLLLAASNGGNEWFPAWYLNLKSDPTASVQLRRRKLKVAAVEASPRERRRLWPKFLESYGGYRQYENRTTRKIPVMILVPEPKELLPCPDGS